MAEDVVSSELLTLLVKRWWVLLIGILLGLALGWGALQAIPPKYSATAVQLIKGIPGESTEANYTAAQYAVARARSYPSFILSSVVLEGVQSDMGGRVSESDVRSNVSAENPVDTPLVRVSATGSTAEEAQELANSASRHLARFITQIETVRGATPVLVETAVPAGLPESPSSPNSLLVLGMGFAGGLAAGVIAAVAITWSGRRGRRPRRVDPDTSTGPDGGSAPNAGGRVEHQEAWAEASGDATEGPHS